MARPKKEKELSRSHLIAFRLTDVEYDFVTSMAQEAGLSASAYIRKLLLEGWIFRLDSALFSEIQST